MIFNDVPKRRNLFTWVVMFEVTIWISLYRWIARKPAGVRPGDRTSSYRGAIIMTLSIIIIVSAIEIPAMHLLLPWRWAQLISLVLGLWGLFWMFGLLGSMTVRPHVINADGMRFRNAHSVNFLIPWDIVGTVAGERRFPESSKSMQIVDLSGVPILELAVGNQTNLRITFDGPVKVVTKKFSGHVLGVRAYADDPDAFIAAAQEHLPESVTQSK